MTEVNPLLQFYRDIKPTLVSGIWFGKSIKEIKNNLDPSMYILIILGTYVRSANSALNVVHKYWYLD